MHCVSMEIHIVQKSAGRVLFLVVPPRRVMEPHLRMVTGKAGGRKALALGVCCPNCIGRRPGAASLVSQHPTVLVGKVSLGDITIGGFTGLRRLVDFIDSIGVAGSL